MFNDNKIIITNNKISIFSYDELKEINTDYITIDNVCIYGKFLRIEEMDEYFIIICGEIAKVVFDEENQ